MYYYGHQYHPADKEIELYFIGCTLKCPGCHNPELHDRNENSKQKSAIEIYKEVEPYFEVTNRILIMGGEPQEQNIDELIQLCTLFKKHRIEIILFTGYDKLLDEQIKNHVDFIKFGRFDQTQIGENMQMGIKLATKNQFIKDK